MSPRPRQNSEPVGRRPMWPNVTALIEGRHAGVTSAPATQADNPGGRVIAQHKCFAALFPGQIKTAGELRDIAPTSAFVTLHTRYGLQAPHPPQQTPQWTQHQGVINH
ncbi:hypothetical protein EKO27_g12080 [Xylaria grammica]|uniref:Uncharacterized protein n=1 Tax=Xylaria grammica TaxID=363999 RepID=A0A439CLI5_9PEZI|nr:hypothetical protein EKO27_g12080 [Xylaria grammica]